MPKEVVQIPMVGAMAEQQRIAYYKYRPAEYLIDVLKYERNSLFWSENEGYASHKWDSTIQFPGHDPEPCPDPLVAFLRCWADGYQDIAIEAATGVQKTYTIAGAGFWYLDTRRPSVIRTYAPNETTLKENMWGYMGERIEHFQELHPQSLLTKDLHLYMDRDSDKRARWSMMGLLAQVTTGNQSQYEAKASGGVRGGHQGHMVHIFEEANAIDPRIWNGVDFTMTSATNQLIAPGNPDDPSDALHLFWSRPNTVRIRISGLDAPNYVCRRIIVPGGAFDWTFPERIASIYGGDRQHPMYQSRVRGICPNISKDALFDERALDAVSRHHRVGVPDGTEGGLDGYPWQKPLYERSHDPDLWVETIRTMAGLEEEETEGDYVEPDMEAVTNEELNIYAVEGVTQIFELPRYDQLNRYGVIIDPAGDTKPGSKHGVLVEDLIEQRTVALFNGTGPRHYLVSVALALARMYAVPRVRDKKMEERIEIEMKRYGDTYVATRIYQACERTMRDPERWAEYDTKRLSYPMLNYETNRGSLHLIHVFIKYPRFYREKRPDVKGARKTRRLGHTTTDGKSGGRTAMMNELRDWGYLLVSRPSLMPSELMWQEARFFQRNPKTRRFEAVGGHTDDLLLAKSISLVAQWPKPRLVPEHKKEEIHYRARRRPKTKKKKDPYNMSAKALGLGRL